MAAGQASVLTLARPGLVFGPDPGQALVIDSCAQEPLTTLVRRVGTIAFLATQGLFNERPSPPTTWSSRPSSNRPMTRSVSSTTEAQMSLSRPASRARERLEWLVLCCRCVRLHYSRLRCGREVCGFAGEKQEPPVARRCALLWCASVCGMVG